MSTPRKRPIGLMNRKKIFSILYGLPYIWIGIAHFIDPLVFVPIVPKAIGFPVFWVYLSGIFEVALGLGLFFARTRLICARIIIAMLVVLSTANINMWWNDISFNGVQMSTTGHIIRGFIQLFLFACAFWIGEVWPFSKPKKMPEVV